MSDTNYDTYVSIEWPICVNFFFFLSLSLSFSWQTHTDTQIESMVG